MNCEQLWTTLKVDKRLQIATLGMRMVPSDFQQNIRTLMVVSLMVMSPIIESKQNHHQQFQVYYDIFPSWCFQPIWTISVKLDHFPKEGWTYVFLKTPPSFTLLLNTLAYPWRLNWVDLASRWTKIAWPLVSRNCLHSMRFTFNWKLLMLIYPRNS